MQFLFQPIIYTLIFSVGISFYLAWILARQQYLGTHPQFSLLSLTILAALLGGGVTQILQSGLNILTWPPKLPVLIQSLSHQPTQLVLLVAYLAAILVNWAYIRRIRYPFWRLMDMNALCLSVIEMGWVLGRFLAQPSLAWGSISVSAALLLLGLFILYHQVALPGLTSAVHLAGIFGIALASLWFIPAWQGMGGSVEYGTNGLVVFLAIVVVIQRVMAHRSKEHQQHALAQRQVPQGASQAFRETFKKAFRDRFAPTSAPTSSETVSEKKEG